MNKIILGKTVKSGKPFKMLREQMWTHTFITGQSGSGKSSLLGRLLEEIILTKSGHILLFDLNYDFSKFNKVDKITFSLDYNQRVDARDNFTWFTEEWKKHYSKINYIRPDSISIDYAKLQPELQAHLLGLDKHETPGAYWLIRLINEDAIICKALNDKKEFEKLMDRVERWFERRYTEEDSKFGKVIHEVPIRLSQLDVANLASGRTLLFKQPQFAFGLAPTNKTFLNMSFFENLIENALANEHWTFLFEHP